MFALQGGDGENRRERIPAHDRGRIDTTEFHGTYFREIGPSGAPVHPTVQNMSCDGDPTCYFGVRDAWTRRTLPPYPRLDSGTGILFAWFAIPVWALVGFALLARRRDLA